MQRIPLPRILARGEPGGRARPDDRPEPPIDPNQPAIDAEYAFRRAELAELSLTVGSRLGDRGRRIASPGELRTALAALLGEAIGDGWVEVRRIPPALHSTEYWHVTLTSVTAEARVVMDRLVEEARCVR